MTASLSPEARQRRKVVHRIARIEGQLRGIKQLIEGDTDCEKIAMQMTAARRALDRAFYEMLACSLKVHVGAAKDMEEARLSIDEMAGLLSRFG